MKSYKLDIAGNSFNLEFDDEFYDFIKKDLDEIARSQSQIPLLLRKILAKEYECYQTVKKVSEISQKLER